MLQRWTKIYVISEGSTVEEYPLDENERHIKKFKMNTRRKIAQELTKSNILISRDKKGDLVQIKPSIDFSIPPPSKLPPPTLNNDDLFHTFDNFSPDLDCTAQTEAAEDLMLIM